MSNKLHHIKLLNFHGGFLNDQPRPQVKRLSFSENEKVDGGRTEKDNRQRKCTIMEPMT